MKYYVVERHYNLKGKLVLESRITGDITDLSWAKTQMDTRFNQKLIDYRHEIKPGAIRLTATKCEMDLEGGKYEIEIMKTSRILTGREILIALNEKHAGNFQANLKEIQTRSCADEDLSIYLNKSKCAVTMLDEKFPELIKKVVLMPPLVIYYRGDLSLIDSRKYIKLTVGMGRDTCEKLKYKAMDDVRNLPANVIVITSDPNIISACIDSSRKHKVILVKPCGMDKKDPRVTVYQEMKIIQQGGLIITPYPDKVDAIPENFIIKNKIMGSIGDATFVVSGSKHSAINILVSFALYAGRDILAYPTWPEYGNTINNSLIAEGATLVENVDDIVNILKI